MDHSELIIKLVVKEVLYYQVTITPQGKIGLYLWSDRNYEPGKQYSISVQ